MRKLASLFIMILAACPTLSQEKQPDKQTPPDYYPLKVGTKWHYQVEVDGNQVDSITNRIAKIEKIDDETLARLETLRKNGDVAASEHLTSTAKGVFRHRFNGLEMTPPICLLKQPFKDGDAWTTTTKTRGQTVVVKCKVSSGEVKVPAGKYKAAIVAIESVEGGVPVSTTYWFAPNVGVVRQTASIGGKFLVLELDKFEAGK